MPRFIGRTELSYVAGGYVGIPVQVVGGEALALKLPGRLDTAANDRRELVVARVGKVSVGNPWDLDVQVDAVEQWLGKVLPVVLNIVWCASI